MALTFDDIRLKEAEKTAFKEKLKTCAIVVSELHAEVARQFEEQTKLPSKDHWQSLRRTAPFLDHTRSVCHIFVTIEYVIREKSFFKDAIVLHGTVYVDKQTASHFYIEGPAELDINILNKYISHVSHKIAQLKGH